MTLREVGNRYKTLSTLGEGGMGAVLLVEDTTSAERVALKVLSPKLERFEGGEAAAALLFKREFRAMARFQHPNNCQVFDFGTLPDGDPYFTMEFVEGQGLDELLPLTEEEAVSVLRQLCLALGTVHRQGFVHGDLKPENIRLRADGVLKLMDFGLADVAGNAHGSIRGTLAYMSPEMAKGGRIDQRSDIYALGAVMYHLLTGAPPFQGATAVDVLRAHTREKPAPMVGARGPLSEAIQQMVARMLEKEPIARYQSVRDVLGELGVEAEEALQAALLSSEFVGRKAELARLQAALTVAQETGRGQAIAVTGPAGVGKSRLMEEFRFGVQLANVPFLFGQATASQTPYGPFVQVLNGLIPVLREVAPGELSQAAPALARLLPELTDGRPGSVLEPDQERLVIQAAVTRLIAAASRRAGAVLVLEDWHQADPLSQETLAYLIRNAASVGLLIVVTAHDEVAGVGEALSLRAFSAEEVRAVAASMLGVSQLPAPLVAQLADWSGGLSSRLGSLLEHLVRTGVFGNARGVWQLPAQLAAKDLPGDISDLLAARLAGLSRQSLELLQLVAVFGAPITLPAAARLLGGSDEVLLDAFDELCQQRLLAFDGHAYAIAGQEFGEAAVKGLPREAVVGLHRRIAEALATALPAEGEPELDVLTALAWHGMKGQGGEPAARCALQAAMRHRDYNAVATASSLLELALETIGALEAAPTHEPLRGHLLEQLAWTQVARHEMEPAGDSLKQALTIAEHVGDKVRQVEALVLMAQLAQIKGTSEDLKQSAELNERVVALASDIGADKVRARAYTNLGRALFFLGQNQRAREVFEQGVAFARERNVPLYAARGGCLLGYLLTLSPGTRELGMRHLRTAVDIQKEIGDKYGEGYTYMVLANVLLQSGMFKEAEAATIRNGEIMEELSTLDDLAVALLNHALVVFERGEFPRMAEIAGRCHNLATDLHHKPTLSFSATLVALAGLYQGSFAGAVERVREQEAALRETSGYLLSSVMPYIIDALLIAGRLQEALLAAQEARDLITSTGNTEIETRLWILMGEIHARLGESPAARSYFERAREHGLKGEEPHIVARADKGLGWMDLHEGRLEAAYESLRRAIEAARQLGMHHLRLECTWLLGELSLAREERGEALGFFQEAAESAAEMAVPITEAISLHGMARATSDPARARRWQQQARERLEAVIGALGDDERAHFLSFTERAQIERAVPEVAVPTPIAHTGPVPDVAPAMPEDAPMPERARWLSREIAHAASAMAGESQRVASIAREYELLAETVGSQAHEIKELQAANHRMEQLIRFSMAVSNLQNLDAILEQAVDMIVELTDAERGFLLFFENGQIRSQVSRVNVDRRSPLDWQFSKSIAEKVLSTGEVVCVFDAMADQQFNQSQSVVDLNLRTVICVPMRIKGRMIGAIYVDRQSVNENFTPSDLEMVLSLAAQAAGAIENARLHQEWVDKSKRLEMLNNLSKTISGSLDMEEVLDLIVKMTLEVSRAERGFLFLVDDADRKLLCRAARDMRSSLPLDQDHEVSMSICTKVLQTGEAENVADALNDEEFQFQQSIMALNLRMVMCVPILAKGVVIGLLYVDSQAVVNAFGEKDLELLKAIAGHASVAIENAKLHAHTAQLADDLKKTFYSFVQALGTSIDAKHPLTSGHSYRVTEYSVRLARRIGLPEDEVENIRIAGLLHDVGKIGTPDHILMKPGSFTNEEYEIMKRHVVHTREILDNIHFPPHQRHIPAMAGAHHEKWDGRGYPNNQAGEDIPFGGRILALGDVFDAITSKRDYREAMPLSQALNIIRQGIGTHFDPALGPEFIKMIEEEGVLGHEAEGRVEAAEAPQEAAT
ncbi:MAG: HD domain-containing phosphohydrolase [Candidatus Sericytochromatia bacterium]|nr:HD domain-containing phosphohydrolase [Candidatus Sericytochromatia bacterium]